MLRTVKHLGSYTFNSSRGFNHSLQYTQHFLHGMSIQIVSDLHLEAMHEYDIFQIIPCAPYLALLGDIGNPAKHRLECLEFLTQQLKHFKAVLYVPGNHEAYHSTWDAALDVFRKFAEDVRGDPALGEFILLDRTAYQLPGTKTTILGCSLFSSIPRDKHDVVGMGINDFNQTDNWTTEKHNEWHQRDVAWLNAQVAELENTDTEIIIFSHWSPSQDARAIDPRHTGSPITSGFSTDMSGQPCFQSSSVRIWAFGHTHYNCDFLAHRGEGVPPLRLVANQRGYYIAQAAGFDGQMRIAA
ncbi:hypothetical protein S7711_01606 [Stachybotrys chartarum IBT 7711]|uniref:Calcineurin-like phosphoesterase domain-containing protein n=1 Tax=Stachybotrys chartarum (strain CBS 109288 / IBT 7711) TaxID=1280523 RepID=A0A084BC79_STACB|nr:hypothetical protein S7711_01606 [Stachybotrys chartarum IBT 7711]